MNGSKTHPPSGSRWLGQIVVPHRRVSGALSPCSRCSFDFTLCCNRRPIFLLVGFVDWDDSQGIQIVTRWMFDWMRTKPKTKCSRHGEKECCRWFPHVFRVCYVYPNHRHATQRILCGEMTRGISRGIPFTSRRRSTDTRRVTCHGDEKQRRRGRWKSV